MQSRVIVSTIAAAISLACTAHASAQSNVAVYGIIDSGIEVINHSASIPGSKANLTRLSSGNLSGSRLGFRGTEDLGGGLKAVFALESGIGVDNGTSLQGGRLFGRQAYVGLQGSWGALTLGRQNSLMLDWMSKYNTMDNATWSSKVHDAAFSDRIDNTVKYSGKFDVVDVAAYYSTGYDSTKGGELAGHSKAGREVGVGAQYNGAAFRAALVYDRKNGQTAALENNTDEHLTFGARYKFGEAEVLGGYLRRKQDNVGAASVRTDMGWIGLAYQVSAPLQLSASLYRTDVKNSDKDPLSLISMVKYSLSKRTDLYLINSYASNRSGSNLGVNGFGVDIAAGQNQFGTMAGVRHTF
ncbi:porin [Rugamonas sp. CCM 8940]|uniref:porin n=1 Tax=Rugamonas sp. CCM 8940 TaxID=2765359 RepID=UPI0018F42730|nr:porin [Rugamonas sp. CCM 8940]MBJ7312661.1 porin [Rugamonas sp. CCM 8940]